MTVLGVKRFDFDTVSLKIETAVSKYTVYINRKQFYAAKSVE